MPADDFGIIGDERPSHAPNLVYDTPSPPFASGAAMSVPRRLEWLRYVDMYAYWMFEDDFSSGYRYTPVLWPRPAPWISMIA
jgi:GntR family transcriptional regulator/MocR family aminotransferase